MSLYLTSQAGCFSLICGFIAPARISTLMLNARMDTFACFLVLGGRTSLQSFLVECGVHEPAESFPRLQSSPSVSALLRTLQLSSPLVLCMEHVFSLTSYKSRPFVCLGCLSWEVPRCGSLLVSHAWGSMHIFILLLPVFPPNLKTVLSLSSQRLSLPAPLHTPKASVCFGNPSPCSPTC